MKYDHLTASHKPLCWPGFHPLLLLSRWAKEIHTITELTSLQPNKLQIKLTQIKADAGTSGSAVRISVCLTSLTPMHIR
jgi:hypothetical protein